MAYGAWVPTLGKLIGRVGEVVLTKSTAACWRSVGELDVMRLPPS